MESPLVIRTCRTSEKQKGLLVLGLAIELVAICLFALSVLGVIGGDWLIPLLVGIGIGSALQVMFIICYVRGSAFVFDASSRTIVERLGGGQRRDVGSFDAFKGVDLVARVNAEALEGTELDEVHKTYPDRSLMVYDVCLVGEDRDPVRVVQVGAKPAARAIQERVVKYCGWTHQGTSIPDSNRELPRVP